MQHFYTGKHCISLNGILELRKINLKKKGEKKQGKEISTNKYMAI